MSDRVHNKSGKSSLSFLGQSDTTLENWDEALQKKIKEGTKKRGLCASRCKILNNKKGVLVRRRKHVCYGYQLVAFKKFGREKLHKVVPNKVATSITVSHLCGTRNCCNGNHLILEPKKINDERTHCHFCLGIVSLNPFCTRWFLKQIAALICPHEPRCGSSNA